MNAEHTVDGDFERDHASRLAGESVIGVTWALNQAAWRGHVRHDLQFGCKDDASCKTGRGFHLPALAVEEVQCGPGWSWYSAHSACLLTHPTIYLARTNGRPGNEKCVDKSRMPPPAAVHCRGFRERRADVHCTLNPCRVRTAECCGTSLAETQDICCAVVHMDGERTRFARQRSVEIGCQPRRET